MNMSDMNWKAWGFFFLIALGLSFELLKRLPSSSTWNLDASKATQERPYSVKSGRVALMQAKMPPAMLPAGKMPMRPAYTPPTMTKEQLAQLLAQQNKGAEGQATEGVEKKKKDGEEWEEVIDPKTGKKMKRKKKKEAKKKDEKKEEEKKVETKKEEPKKASTTEADIEAALAHSLATGQLNPPPPANEPDEPFNSAEEWSRRLLSRPDLAETNRFIDHHNRNLVTDEVFYHVVGQMLEDSRVEMKKLGVLALSQTKSVLSFSMLAQVSRSERSDSTVRQAAEQALDPYGKEFGRVGILANILKAGGSGYTVLLATRKLEDSAKKNLTAAPATAPNQVSQQQAASVRSRNLTYQRFIPILTGLSKSNDASVKSQATQTLATLQGLLTSTTASAEPATAPAS